MAEQNMSPKEVRVLQVQSPLGDILFYERKEAGKFRDGMALPGVGEAHPTGSRWPNHKLCGITEDGELGWLRFYYAATRASQQDYNYEYGEMLADEYPAVRQTWVIPRVAVAGWTGSYAPGGIAAPPSLGGRTWTYQGESQQRTDPTTDGLFVVVNIVYWDISTPRSGVTVDLETGEIRPFTKQIVAAGSATGLAVTALGIYREVGPINRLWSETTTRSLAGLAGAATKSRVWQSFEPWSWPAVLNYIAVAAIPAPQAAGGGIEKISWWPVWKRPRFTGGCLQTITEVWSRTPPVVEAEDILLEQEIRFAGGMMVIDVPPCLHGPITIQEGTSVDTERFGAYVLRNFFPATNFTDWPATIVGRVTVTPSNAGYLKRTLLINRPTMAGGIEPIVLTLVGAIENQIQLAWVGALISSPDYHLEVSRSATFSFDFVEGYNPYEAGAGTGHTVVGLAVDRVYYARVSHRPDANPANWVYSNTVVGLLNGGPVIEVWDEDAEVRTENGVELYVGEVVVGISGVTNMTVRNTGSYPLVITGAVIVEEVPWGGFATDLTPQTVAPGEEAEFTITFTPDAYLPGFQYGSLIIYSQTPVDGVYTLPLMGNATEGVLVVQQPYGTEIADEVTVGLTYSTFTLFRIRNEGDGTLRVTVALTAPAGLSLNNGAGEALPGGIIEIAPGGFQNFGVGQTSYGIDGVVTITSNDAYQPTFTINVEGEDA